MKQKIGICLSGGGLKGAYQVGIWRAMRELGIPIHAVTGASVGSINGAAIAQQDYGLLIRLWGMLEKKTFFSHHAQMEDENKKGVRKSISLGRKILANRGLDTTPFKDVIRDNLDEDRIRESPVDFGFSVYSVTERKGYTIYKEDIPKGQLAEFVIASASFPFFKPHQIGDKFYSDGGIHDNLPVSLLLETRPDIIITVDLTGITSTLFLKGKYKLPVGTQIHAIRPSEPLGGVFDFSRERINANIEIGYEDGLRFFEQLMA